MGLDRNRLLGSWLDAEPVRLVVGFVFGLEAGRDKMPLDVDTLHRAPARYSPDICLFVAEVLALDRLYFRTGSHRRGEFGMGKVE